jgi:hypothetical protein
MPDTSSRVELAELVKSFERIDKSFPAPGLLQAATALVSAIQYKDDVLIAPSSKMRC